MESLLALAALSFGEVDHDVADLVLVGLLTGDWQALEHAVARGNALEAQHPAAVAAVEVEEALTAFRYERGLIAGAEMHAWLDERSLSLSDVQGVLRRRLLRARFPTAAPPADELSAVAGLMRAEAICGGTLARCAEVLRRWHAGREALAARGEDGTSGDGDQAAAEPAAADELVRRALADPASGLPSLGPDQLRRRAARLTALRAAHERFEASAVPQRAVVARIEERRLEWTALTGSELGFDREGAALETRLQVVHDGRTLSEVARMLGLEPVQRTLELTSAPGEIGAELLAARPGELVGPWHEDGRWRVLQLDARLEPGPADERACGRAREELLGELVERFSAGKAVALAAL